MNLFSSRRDLFSGSRKEQQSRRKDVGMGLFFNRRDLFSGSRKGQEMKKMRCWNGFVLQQEGFILW